MKYVRKIIGNYCVLDLETTGLSPNYDSIIEIGIIKVKENKIVDKYNSLINPGFLINEYITSITGITNEMLKGKPKIIDLKKEVLNFIGNDVLVGHNISFDVSFLQKGFNEELKNEYIDTLQFCRKLFKELSHHRLTDMSNYLEISRNEHRSMSDCLCTKELYDCIKEKMKNNGLEINDIFAKKNYSSKNIDIHAIKPDNIEIDEDNFFYNKHCVFTGKLEKMIRKDAMQLVVNVGGILDNSVTKKTNYLILGNNDYCSSIKDGKSSKHKKAEKYKLEGQDIEIIDEDTFYNLFNLN